MKLRNNLSLNIKIALLIAALMIASGTFFYTQDLVNRLQKREKELVQLYAKGLEYITNINKTNTDLTFIFENIIKRIDFPIVLTDANDNVNITGISGGFKNVKIDSTLTPAQLNLFFRKKISELRKLHPPILVTYRDSIILTKIYYGDSAIVERLKYYPYLQIFFAVFFILIAYVGFSHVKKNEQSNIWVGMAKETAHQLGTPISSLMGWIELLKLNHSDPNKVLDLTAEMEGDLERLRKITKRFSQIGSKPALKKEELGVIIKRVVKYFKRRLPNTGKQITFKLTGELKTGTLLNDELFEWVVENLIKNAIDAIDKERGEIKIKITEKENNIIIDFTDTGKGIDLRNKNEIFRPGFSTKKRGWGLGLSLTKRIVEDYHKGKIFLLNSTPGKGSCFRIVLKK